MREKLQEALLAVKGGDEEKARLLLAQYLREEPDYVPGWVLLSKLATSDVQKVAFLRKVLSLDPDHQYAQEEMARLTGATPPEISEQMAVEQAETEAETAVSAGERLPEEQSAAQVGMAQMGGEEGARPEAEAVAVEDTPEAMSLESEPMAVEEESPEAVPWEEKTAWDEEPMPWEEEWDEEAADEVEDEAASEGEDLDWFLPEPDDEVPVVTEAPATSEEVGPQAEEEEFDFSIFDMEEDDEEVIAEESLNDDLFDYEGESFEAQARGETMPAWMAESDIEEEAVARQEDAGDGDLLAQEDLPDWLQEEPDAEWLGEAEVLRRNSEESEAETEARLKAAMAEGRKRRAEQPVETAATSRGVIIALVLLALLVFLAAVYFAAVYLF